MDPKVDFYWRNRAQIEEWASLRSTAADLLVEEFRAQTDRLQELAAAAEDVSGLDLHDPVLVGLTRPSWLSRGIQLQVGLSWQRSSLLGATGVNRPWVGVRIGSDDDRRRGLFDGIKRTAAEELRGLSWSSATKNWPGWTYLEPRDDEDIRLFAHACGNEVVAGWTALAPRLDDAVAQLADV